MKSLKLLAATAAATMLVIGTAQAGDAAAGKAKAEACADCHEAADFAGEDVGALTQMIKDVVAGKTKHKAKVTISGVENRPGVAAQIFTALADKSVNVDTIIQNQSQVSGADVSFTVPLDEVRLALDTLEGIRESLGFRELTSDDQIGKVTLVGAGMKSEPGVAAKMFRVLSEQGINLQMIDTSTIRITVVIDRREVERAVRALHDAFDLAGEAARRADV